MPTRTMAVDAVSLALAELVRKAELEPGLAGLGEGVRVLAAMQPDVEQHRGAERHNTDVG